MHYSVTTVKLTGTVCLLRVNERDGLNGSWEFKGFCQTRISNLK